MAHPNEDLVRRGYEAFSNGDMETLSQIQATDVVHISPGNNQLSGEYKGQEEVFGYYGKLAEVTDGTFKVELESVRAEGDDKVIARHRNLAQRGDKSLNTMETLTFTILNGKMISLVEVPDDQAAMDDFFG
jgi:uncharacterized protein